ncbi:MAG: toprim domain-containing protein [Candidatus Nanoarchaeia archaeon]|nr:toprim domain-containing protein [Candidatus Nanoarchaeia archaeon]
MELQDYIDKINEKKLLVIVEGKNDEKALKEIGIKKIYAINRKAIYRVIEDINEKEVVILTDLDKEGKKIYSMLRTGLQRRGIRINNELRDFLFKTELRQIEGLPGYIGKRQDL